MKLYISMPMKGKSQEQIIRERNIAIARAFDELKNGDAEYSGGIVEVINQIQPDYKELHPLVCLGRSIAAMAEADVVYFAEGWNKARGCIIEHQCACSYGKLVITA